MERLVRASPIWDAESGVLLPPCCLGQSVVLGPVWDAPAPCCPGQSVVVGPIWDAPAPCCPGQSVVLGPIWDARGCLGQSVWYWDLFGLSGMSILDAKLTMQLMCN